MILADVVLHLSAGEPVGVDDGHAGARPVCDPLPGRDGDLLERCAAHAGRNALLPGHGNAQKIPSTSGLPYQSPPDLSKGSPDLEDPF